MMITSRLLLLSLALYAASAAELEKEYQDEYQYDGFYFEPDKFSYEDYQEPFEEIYAKAPVAREEVPASELVEPKVEAVSSHLPVDTVTADGREEVEEVALPAAEGEDDYCEEAKLTCAEETCAGREVAVNRCEKGERGEFTVECSCISGGSFWSSSAVSESPSKTPVGDFAPTAAMMRNAPIDIMFNRRFGPQVDDFGMTPFGCFRPRMSGALRLARMLDDRASAGPLFPELFGPSLFGPGFQTILMDPEQARASDDPKQEVESELPSGSLTSPFSLINLSPARVFSITFQPQPRALPSDISNSPDEVSSIKISEIPEGLTQQVRPDAYLKQDPSANSGAGYVPASGIADSDEVSVHVGCSFFSMFLLFILISFCCCYKSRRQGSEPEKVTVDVIDVEAYTPLMETYVESFPDGETPLKPLEREDIKKPAL